MTTLTKKYVPVLLNCLLSAILIACSTDSSRLAHAELLLETSPIAADSLLSTMPLPASNRNRAWYAVLKTQTQYKQYKPITSDSLILTATNYYGTRHKSYRSAMAWYTQGCVYSEIGNHLAAINAYLKAIDLFPDTLVRYYTLAEQKLGALYLDRMMLEQCKKQLENCRINAIRLGDTKVSNFAFLRLGLCALYDMDYKSSDSIFTEIIESNSFSYSHKTLAKLQKAKINLYYRNNYRDALLYVDSYIKDMEQASDPGTGYSVKADIFYQMKEYDSAFFYYTESMKYDVELYTRCSNADRLAELSASLHRSNESSRWHILYGELRDSINSVERKREIEELQFQHKESMIKERYLHKHRIILIMGSSILLIMLLTLLFLYSTFKQKEKERIMKKQQELQEEEERIRKSTIELLESKIKDYSNQDPEARSILLKTYSNRLKMCTNSFRNTQAYNLLSTIRLNLGTIKKDERELLFNQIKQSYLEAIADIQIEIPNISENDILTIILKHLGLSIEQTAKLFSITPDSIKKRLYRQSQRIPSDLLNIYCD